MQSDFDATFQQLRAVMAGAAPAMSLAADTPGDFVLKTPWLDAKKKEPAWFGAVQVKKGYVAYHLLPLYSHPELIEEISPALRRRMQGKSCFNFRRPEPELFEELERLTRRGALLYARPIEARPHG